MLSIDDLEVRGRVVLVRSDLNTPLETLPDGSRRITDDGRIRAALPTISDLAARGARVVVVSHLGRPKGDVVAELSLAPVARRMSELIGAPVAFAADTVGPESRATIAALRDGEVAVLENLRFTAAETSKVDTREPPQARQRVRRRPAAPPRSWPAGLCRGRRAASTD
jgi:phosphoglycerate kinase